MCANLIHLFEDFLHLSILKSYVFVLNSNNGNDEPSTTDILSRHISLISNDLVKCLVRSCGSDVTLEKVYTIDCQHIICYIRDKDAVRGNGYER